MIDVVEYIPRIKQIVYKHSARGKLTKDMRKEALASAYLLACEKSITYQGDKDASFMTYIYLNIRGIVYDTARYYHSRGVVDMPVEWIVDPSESPLVYVINSEYKSQIKTVFHRLKPRNKDVLRRRCDGETLQHIANRYKLDKAGIYRIEQEAILSIQQEVKR